jgi:hypothetical protein
MALVLKENNQVPDSSLLVSLTLHHISIILYEEFGRKTTIIRRQISARLIQVIDDLPNLVPTSTIGTPGAKCWSSGIH